MTRRKNQRPEQVRKPLLHISAVGLLVIGALPAFASKPDSVPDWVRTAAQQKLPQYPPDIKP